MTWEDLIKLLAVKGFSLLEVEIIGFGDRIIGIKGEFCYLLVMVLES